MRKTHWVSIIRWIARIWGGIAILIVVIAIYRELTLETALESDLQATILKASLIIGLVIAYKWELLGGAIATLGILITGFLHPVVLGPGILYIVVALLSWKIKWKGLLNQEKVNG